MQRRWHSFPYFDSMREICHRGRFFFQLVQLWVKDALELKQDIAPQIHIQRYRGLIYPFYEVTMRRRIVLFQPKYELHSGESMSGWTWTIRLTVYIVAYLLCSRRKTPPLIRGMFSKKFSKTNHTSRIEENMNNWKKEFSFWMIL